MIDYTNKSYSKNFIFNEEKLKIFADLCEDFAPVHFKKDFAIQMGFKDRVVHGFLISSIFSAILGNKLPGKHSVIRNINLNFINPLYLNDEITFNVKVDRVNVSVKNIQLLLSAYRKKDNLIIIKGEASCILKNE